VRAISHPNYIKVYLPTEIVQTCQLQSGEKQNKEKQEQKQNDRKE